MEKKKCWISTLAMILILIGGLNWGLVGFFEFDLVEKIFGMMTTASRVVYALVGLSALFLIIKGMITGKCCQHK